MKNDFSIKNKKGMTLIELLIAVAIILIMSSIAFSFLGGGRSSSQVESEAMKLVSALRLAQQYSTGIYQPDLSKKPCAYQVSYSATNYEMGYLYDTGLGCGPDFEKIASYQMENSVKINSSGKVVFPAPSGDISPANIIVEKQNIKNCVSIKSSGAILRSKSAVCD